MVDIFLFLCILALVIDNFLLRNKLNKLKDGLISNIKITLDSHDRLNVIEDFFSVQAGEITQEEYQKKWGIDSVRTKDSNIS